MTPMLTAMEHVDRAEILLRDAEQTLATAQSQHDWRRVEYTVAVAQTHALIATAMKTRS